VADDHDQHTQADRPTPGDSDALERLMRADGSAWRAWVQPSVERLETRIHAMSASDSLWARLAPRLEPRDLMDAAQEAMDGYHVSPMLREIELEDIVGTDSDTDRQLHTIRPTRLDADWTPTGRERLVAILTPVAAVLLLAALVGVLLAQQGRTPTAGVPTVIQRGQLTWQNVSLPQGLGLVFGSRGVGLYPSPSDGDTAYVCATSQENPSAHPHMWVTHDRALHWSRLADVPTTRDATACDLGVDRLDPRVLTVTAYLAGADGGSQTPPELSGSQTPPEQWQQFVSVDGGKTWSSYTAVGSVFLLGSQIHATWQGKTYATRYPFPLRSDTLLSRLYVSDDQMRTWTEIDGPILSSPAVRALPAAMQSIGSVQVNPSTGELLVILAGLQLWDSRDGGAHWTQLAVPIQALRGQYAPDSSYPIQRVAIAAPAAGQPWHICALIQPATIHKDTPFPLVCTSDGGTTWTTRLGLIFPACVESCEGVSSPPGALEPLGVLADGAVFGRDSVGILRLPPDATSVSAWVRLGEFPRLPGSGSDPRYQIVGGIDGIYGNQMVTPSGGLALWIVYRDGAIYTTTLR
jgi:hypothetical protein